MKALSRRLAAIERARAQNQHCRIVWPTEAVALAAGVSWPVLLIGDTLPAGEWAVLAQAQQAESLRRSHDETIH